MSSQTVADLIEGGFIGAGGVMRVVEVREIVEAARVDPTYYSFEGDRHEALCLLAEGQRWKVFLSERGPRHEEKSSDSEDGGPSTSSSGSSSFGIRDEKVPTRVRVAA